jgi:hypothetical protein
MALKDQVAKIPTWLKVLVVVILVVVYPSISETAVPKALIPIVVFSGMAWAIFSSRKSSKPKLTSAEYSLELLDAQITELNETIEFFKNYQTNSQDSGDSGIIVKAGEHILGIASNVGLIETRRGPTNFQGGSQGISVRVAKGISLRQSRARGKAIQGDEEATVIDEGQFVVTDQRGFFAGTKQTREFKWSNLVAIKEGQIGRNAVLYLPVSNREKVSGIAGDAPSLIQIQRRIEFGVAVEVGTTDDYFASLHAQIVELSSEKITLQQEI